MRNNKSGSDQLFVTHRKPFLPAKANTIANWLKNVLDLAGINTGRYSAHSYRSSSTSAAAFSGISIGTILKSASWKNADVFKKHYLTGIGQLDWRETRILGRNYLISIIMFIITTMSSSCLHILLF